jgi:parvulin-like peptidyl-prolyl isomerase
MWKENYQYNIMQSLLMDSISVVDEEINREFINRTKSKNPVTFVNIIEVLTSDLQIAEKVLNETSSVVDFHELAEKYSERALTKGSRGESGLFPATQLGEIGRIAQTMEVGDVYGPLKTEEGYSIFKLIDKIDKQDTLTVLSEGEKETIKTEIKYRKMRENLSKYTAGLAAKFGISINNEALEKITISTINSVVYKHMGFGGRILAVPLISINDDWVEQWKQKLNQ